MSMDKYASEAIISLADDLIMKLEANDQVINERRISNLAAGRLSGEVVVYLQRAASESQGSGEDVEIRLQKLLDAISSLVGSLETSLRSSNEELIRLEATQDGMRRALEAVRSTGQIRLQEIGKLEDLMSSEDAEVITKSPAATKKNRSKEIVSKQ